MVATPIFDTMNYFCIRNCIESRPGITFRSGDVEEQRNKRTEIAQHTTAISIATVVIPWIFLTVILGNFYLDLEEKTLISAISYSVTHATRNPLISKFACKVNERVQAETVDDRRQREINDAIKRRAERQSQLKEQNSQVHQTQPTAQNFQEVDPIFQEINPMSHWIWNQNNLLPRFGRYVTM